MSRKSVLGEGKHLGKKLLDNRIDEIYFLTLLILSSLKLKMKLTLNSFAPLHFFLLHMYIYF